MTLFRTRNRASKHQVSGLSRFWSGGTATPGCWWATGKVSPDRKDAKRLRTQRSEGRACLPILYRRHPAGSPASVFHDEHAGQK